MGLHEQRPDEGDRDLNGLGVEPVLKEETSIRVLVVGDEPEDAEHVTSLMRGAGYSVKPIRVDELEPLKEAIEKNQLDIALHTLSAVDVKLSDTIESLRTRNLFVPVLAYGESDLDTGKALAAGAADRIAAGDDEHLRHAMLREFEHVLSRREAHFLREAYTESEKRARALMESSRDAIAYIHDGMHVLANDAYLARFGYGIFEEIEGMPIMDMVTGGDRDELKKMLRVSATSDEAVGKLELELKQAEGSTFRAEVEFSRASIEGEACSQIIIRDQGNAEELEKQLTLLSQRDNVTGLYNRQYFMKAVTETVSRAERGEAQAAMFQIVLDDFSSIRSRVGVIGSDQVVADIASVLSDTCGDDDVIARLDGATFALLTPTVDRKKLDKLAAKIGSTIKEHICDVEGNSLNVTATMGISRIDGNTGDPNDILTRAERALGEAIENGPNTYRIYEPKPGEMSQKEIDGQWVERIKDILKNDRLTLLYQPIVSLHDDTTERYEIVPSVLDDKSNPADMQEMMAAAERTGMSKGIDRWVVLNSLKALVEQLKNKRETSFFIPLSGNAFDDPGLFRWIHDRLKTLKLPRHAVVFQIDTTATTTRIKQANAFATAVHKIDCGISLAGFGNGNDPFQITRHVPVDYVKINDQFMQELAGNEQNQEAIRQIATQARSQNMGSICPGVNDAGALTVLWSLGTDMIQGDFMQEPSRERNYDFSSMAM